MLLRGATERIPEDAELLLRTAVAICRTDPAESRSYAQRAVAIAPEDPTLLFRSASLLFSLGDFDEARKYARRARSLATKDFPFLVDLIHLAGKLAEEKGNHADAEKALLIAFTEAPATIGHGRALAEFYLGRGRLAEALDVASEALRHLEDDEALQDLRAGISAQMDSDGLDGA